MCGDGQELAKLDTFVSDDALAPIVVNSLQGLHNHHDVIRVHVEKVDTNYQLENVMDWSMDMEIQNT